MSRGYDLNDLVEMGKQEALDFINGNLRINAEEESHINPKIRTMLALSMKKSDLPLDVTRLRRLMITENRDILGAVNSDSFDITAAFAIVVGRVTLIRECIEAADRVAATLDKDGAMAAHLGKFRAFLVTVEKASIRLKFGAKDVLVPCTICEAAPEFMSFQADQAA